MTRAAPAKKRKRSAQTAISSMAAPTGLPALALSSRPSSSALASMRVGDLQQEQGSILRGRLLPGLEGGLGRVDRAVDVLGRAGRHVRDDLVVRRIDDLGRPAVGGIDELAADELLIGLDSLEGVGHGMASWGVTGRVGSVLIVVRPRESVPRYGRATSVATGGDTLPEVPPVHDSHARALVDGRRSGHVLRIDVQEDAPQPAAGEHGERVMEQRQPDPAPPM